MLKPKVLVWGAYGFIGRHVARFLVRNGVDVTVLTRPRQLYDLPEWDSNVRHFELPKDVSERAIFNEALQGIDVVFNFAGSSGAVASNLNPLYSLDANCRTQLEFLEACASAGRRPHVVFSSSRLVYGETGMSPVDENRGVDPRSIYACHKLCVENYLKVYARQRAITYTICRISNVYGEDDCHRGQEYRVINGFIKRAFSGLPLTIFGDGRQVRDFIYIDDLVDALWLCGTMDAARNELFVIGSGRVSTMLEAAKLIRQLTKAPPISFIAWPKDYEIVESGDFLIDPAKSRSRLGFTSKYDLAQGVSRTIDLYRKLNSRHTMQSVDARGLSLTAESAERDGGPS